MRRTVSELIDDARHVGPLDGAPLRGEAGSGDRLLIHVGLWIDGSGRVARARFRSSTCAALIAYAEAACALVEQEALPVPPAAERIRAAVAGVHPLHHDRAALVGRAFSRALARRAAAAGGTP